MNTLVLYDTVRGKSRKVARRLGFNMASITDNECLDRYGLVIFVCPTYGDEELPGPMEDFLVSLDIRSKSYAICELGNYYGYEDKTFGAMKIIKHHLELLDWCEVVEPLSLDSMPHIDWTEVDVWKEKINAIVG